jgi:hypothetical protein
MIYWAGPLSASVAHARGLSQLPPARAPLTGRSHTSSIETGGKLRPAYLAASDPSDGDECPSVLPVHPESRHPIFPNSTAPELPRHCSWRTMEVGRRAPVISGDQNDKTAREKVQQAMAEKTRCSRWMVARQRCWTTCTEQQRRTDRSGGVSVPDELRRDTGLHDPKVYYNSR